MLPLEVEKDFPWDELFDSIEEGRVAPVIGPELLRLSIGERIVPLHTYLAERLAERLRVSASNLPEQGALHEVARRFLSNGGKIGRVYSGLKAVLPADEELPIPEPLLKLAAILPLRLFATTTFDPLLERALDRVRFGGEQRTRSVSYYPEAADPGAVVSRADEAAVVHLLGRISSFPEYAVTEEDMLEFVHSMQAKTPALVKDLRRMRLLLLGCSFPDWLTRFFLRLGLDDRLSSQRGLGDVLADRQPDPRLLDFLTSFCPEALVYPGDGIEFVDELYRRWMALHPSAEPGPGPRLAVRAGVVFLSYAHEDETAARAIRDALAAAGLEVWFDKSSLEAGDAYERDIRRAIRSCSLFVAVLSRHTVTPDDRFFWIEWREAMRAAERIPEGRKYLIPVAIDDVNPEEEFVPEAFRALHWECSPGGHCDPAFIEGLRDDYQRYQQWSRRITP